MCAIAVGGSAAVAQAVPGVATPATLHVVVRGGAATIEGAVVAKGRVAQVTNASGGATLLLPPGASTIITRRIGYAPDTLTLVLVAGSDTTITRQLTERVETIAPVIVSSTRSERRVEDEPLRIEVLAGEDVGEKTQMHPADLRVLLTEMSGVSVQATSPSLGGAAVRILGASGRYTQVLTDGLPLYGAQAGSFGLLQMPPLDLRQAEVIKGAASALYGPGAVGGVLNLISRRPSDSSDVLVNANGRGGTDAVAFLARDAEGRGATVLAGVHAQRAADVNGDGWSDVPGFRRIEIRPRFFASDSVGNSLMVTAGALAEDRGGGSASGATLTNTFPESLTTRHADVGLSARTRVTSAVSIAVRAAANLQDRVRRFGIQRERERAETLFGEVTGTVVSGAQTMLAGVAVQLERYRNRDVARFDEDRSTPAVFAQETYVPRDWLSTQLNGRCDLSSTYGSICTPRVSLLMHAQRAFSVRLSGGTAWAAPTALTGETELFGLTRVVGPLNLDAERARSASLDVSSTRGPFEASATLFASRVANPVGLRRVTGDTTGALRLVNAIGSAHTHGAELFGVYNEEPVIVTAFYALARTRETSPETGRLRETPYVPRETGGLDVAFEEDESGTRFGIEAFYTGPQALDENPYRAVAPGYATIGLLASQRFGAATVYVNLENLTNVRQTSFDPLLRRTPGEGGRLTVDEWAPLEGRAINAGLRWRL
ncbi:MAG: TonB-dependent receptor [Gemmatimonadota bacterium]|nr:TonB-dependent receptor [Gemmatimonadota bacterium]